MTDSDGASPDLDHVEVWIFDLDNTLYPAACNLFDQIDRRMGEFIGRLLTIDRAEARVIQKGYFRKHGTTLRGLMLEHGLDPAEFLDYVHDIDLSPVPPNPDLERALDRLDGRKLVFTNGSVPHAERVMARLGVAHHFEAVFDIVASDYVPKPDPAPYRMLIDRHRFDPRAAAMFEDIPRNLVPAAALGMTTVWVPGNPNWSGPNDAGEHVHHVAEDLAAWLGALAPAAPDRLG